MNKFRDDQIEGEDDGILEDIIAEIDRESSSELGGESPMNGSPDPDDTIHDEEDNDNPPEWEFSPNEAISQNPEYQFCPHTQTTNSMPIHLTLLPTFIFPHPIWGSSNWNQDLGTMC